MFIGLPNAFDSIDYDALLVKLETYGITGMQLSWFKDLYRIQSNQIRCSSWI